MGGLLAARSSPASKSDLGFLIRQLANLVLGSIGSVSIKNLADPFYF